MDKASDNLSGPGPVPLHPGLMILAAGASTRMGRPKQLLPVRGKPLLLHAVESALASPVWPVVVVLGAHAEKIRPLLARFPVIVVENAAWSEGMAASIRTGIAALQQFSRATDAAIVALCDQPAFSATTIGRLLAAQRVSGRSIVAARYHNRRGAPALFLRSHFPALASLTGEEGARALLNPPDEAQRETVDTVEMPELGIDLDTPDDYQAMQAQQQ